MILHEPGLDLLTLASSVDKLGGHFTDAHQNQALRSSYDSVCGSSVGPQRLAAARARIINECWPTPLSRSDTESILTVVDST